MSQATPSHIRPEEILRVLSLYRRRWMIPAATIALLAGLYAVLRPDTWQASQALLVRQEAAGDLSDAGKFRTAEDMKATQETILEVAKSQGVLKQTLEAVGPPAGVSPQNWPQPLDVAEFAKLISLSPPKGAEFGKTEVLYLTVEDHDRSRAIALATALCDQLENRFQQLRDAKSQSMIDELAKAVALTEDDLQAATGRLAKMEKEVGGDLAELRSLHESFSGDSDLRRMTTELEAELRQAQLEERNHNALYHLLSSSRVDQGRLLATPSRLLESQPSLKRLKEGLVDAQLRTAQLAGGMSEAHPKVKAAREAEQEISRHLHNELAIALRGVKVDLNLAKERVKSLADQLASSHQRLERLAGARAEYTNLVAEVKHRTSLVEAARRDLAEARSCQAGAHCASLMNRIDGPATGVWPIGPSRSVIVLAGLVGGVLTGVGILMLTVPGIPAAEPAAAAPKQAPQRAPQPTIPYPTPELAPAACVASGELSFRRVLEKSLLGKVASL